MSAVLVCAGAAGAAEPEDSFREGIAALDQKNWTIAVASFRRAIAARSVEGGKSIRISARSTWFVEYLPHYYLGVALSQLGDLDGATSSWKESLRQGAIQKTAMHDELLRRMKNLGIDSRTVVADSVAAVPDAADPEPRAGSGAISAEAGRATEEGAAGTGKPASGGEVAATESERPRVAIPDEAVPQGARPGGIGIPPQAAAAAAGKEIPSSPVGPAVVSSLASPGPAEGGAASVPDTGGGGDRERPETSRSIDATRRVAALYFAGRYAEARAELTSIRQGSGMTPVLCMLEAAAAYAQYRAAGESDQGLLREARDVARRCRAGSGTAAPSDRLFSPAFRSFWSSAK